MEVPEAHPLAKAHPLLRVGFRWSWWLGALAIVTFLLTAPGTWFGEEAVRAKIGGLTAGKLIHVGGYALLAATAGWLPASLRWRHFLIPLLLVHGGLTELVQTLVPAREGAWRDVAIDAFGVALGFGLSRRQWPGDTATDG